MGLFSHYCGGVDLLMPAMEIQGMEVFAIAVVGLMFVMVLKQFGMWEPLSLEGK